MSNQPPKDIGPPPRGSITAPMLPRLYEHNAEMILPKAFLYFKPVFLVLAFLLNLAVSMIHEPLLVRRNAEIVTVISLALHIMLILYALHMTIRHFKAGFKGAEIYSPRMAGFYRSMPFNLGLIIVVTIIVYVWSTVRYLNEEYWLSLPVVVYAASCVWALRSRFDTLSMFSDDYFISGLYRVYYEDVAELREVSRALPGVNLKAEKKVFFELYDADGEYMGRDMMMEGDYNHLEEIINGTDDAPESGRAPAVRRYAEKKKKKSPLKKGK